MDKKTTKKKIWDSKALWVIISIFSSILLWVFVTSTQGDLIEQTYDGVAIEFKGSNTLREKNGLVVTNISANTVTVTLRGTRRELSSLKAKDIVASIDVSKITAVGSHSYNCDISFVTRSEKESITVVSTSPKTVQFYIDKTNTKTIELRDEFIGSVAEGFAKGDVVFDPQTVNISGPENELNQVAYAVVVISREDLDKTLKFDSAYILVDDEGNELKLSNITLERETVSVTLPITSTKEVPLTVDIIDGGGATSENVKITCVPETITIAGDAETLAGINKISVGTVDLASFSSTFEDTFTIVLDNNISNVTGIMEAKVIVQVIGLETKKFSCSNISIINPPAGHTGQVVTKNIEVILRGSSEVIGKIKTNNIRAVVDLADIGSASGTFQRMAKISVDGFTGVGAVGEYPIYVQVS